jgi:hypothetical protein
MVAATALTFDVRVSGDPHDGLRLLRHLRRSQQHRQGASSEQADHPLLLAA